jgi:hypothetical protein
MMEGDRPEGPAAMMTIDGGRDQRSTVRGVRAAAGSGAGCRRSDREEEEISHHRRPMDGSCAGGGRALNANASPAGLCTPPAARGVAHEAWSDGHAPAAATAAPVPVVPARGRPHTSPRWLARAAGRRAPAARSAFSYSYSYSYSSS